MDYLLLFGGIFILIISGELLVNGSVGLAVRFRISPLVIGLTIISFGTSAPELLVCIKSALLDHPDIAMGNVVGSNIANLGLILGITALIYPITIRRNSIRIDWPFMMIASVVLYLIILDQNLNIIEGALFVTALIGYNTWLIRKSRKAQPKSSSIDIDAVENNLYSPLINRTDRSPTPCSPKQIHQG